MTSSQQKMAKSFEDALAGRYRIKASPSVIDVEIQSAAEKQQRIMLAARAAMQHMPSNLQPALERILLRSALAPN